LTIDPGTVSTLGSGFTAPAGIAIDAAGNQYIADSSASSIYEFAPGNSTAVATLGSNLNAPQGVAVDGAGNLFIADTGNNQIVEIPVVNGKLSTAAQMVIVSAGTTFGGSVKVPGPSMNAPEGIAVDGSGNLYIADSGNGRIVFIPYNGTGWTLSAALTLGSNLQVPSAVTLDNVGNVYVTDSGSGDVYELQLPLLAPLQTMVASGYSKPSGVVVDPSGALFVVDQGNNSVWRIPNLAGTLTPTSAVNIVSQLNAQGLPAVAHPYGVALDQQGNAYITDAVDVAAYMVTRTSSTQSMGTWAPGTTSTPVPYYLENEGNSALTLGTPYETASGSTTQFSLLSSGAGLCANGASVTAGASCNVDAEFNPTASASGAYTYTLALSSNAVNASNQSITYTGRSEITAATTTNLTQTAPSGAPAYDQSVTFSVAVSSVVAANGTPTGAVSLLVDGVSKQTVLLSSGSATFTLAAGAISGGNHTFQVNFLGGSNASETIAYSQSSSTPLNIDVTTVASSTTLTYNTAYVSPNSQPTGVGLLLTATVSTTFVGTPTGTVLFTVTDSAGNKTTGSGVLASGAAGNQATYTYVPTAPSGTSYYVVSVAATYQGDINFSGSASTASSFDVGPANGSVVINNNGLNVTANSSGSNAVVFTITSYGGWGGIVGFTCNPSTLPANATCVFEPGQVQVLPSVAGTIYPPTVVNLKLAINQQPEVPANPSAMIWWISIPTGLLLLVMRRRVKQAAAASGWNLFLMLAAVGMLSTGFFASTGCTGTSFATPKGTSTVTVIASVDPYQTGSQTSTQACGVNAKGNSDPSVAPCSQTSFQVSVAVQ
jgi:sugar lactone lactonase YvrE